jgi:hypothetical protein
MLSALCGRKDVPITVQSRPARLVDVIALLAVIGWTCYAALGTNVFGKKPWPHALVDYHYLYDFSRDIVAHKIYPRNHAYPPSGIILHYLTAQFPFPVSAALFLALTMASALACWWLLLRTMELPRLGAFVLVALALAASSYYFLWDLKSQNCNMIFLLSVLLCARYLIQGRPCGAGFWLAFSFSLKLFSVLIIPYLLWRGQRRAFLWTLAFVAVFWIVLPVFVFGGAGTIEVYQNWLERLAQVSADRVDLDHSILISLHNSAYWLSDGIEPVNSLIINAIRAAWLVLMLIGLARTRCREESPRDAFGLLADVSLLLLAPIAISPYLEPYHPVAVAIPALLLLQTISDGRQRVSLRWLALALFLAALASSKVPCDWGVRGLMVNLHLLLATGGAAAIAWRRQLAIQVIVRDCATSEPERQRRLLRA